MRFGWTALALAWLLLVVVKAAWQCDDAYITFRTADNLWHGLGATWNPGERVQAYTSPLWLAVATLCRGLSGEIYFSSLVASLALTAAAAALLAFRLGLASWTAVLVLGALSTSVAVMDYATSGLENPLLYLLVVVFVREARRPGSEHRLLRLAACTSLLGLTRLDALLLAAPMLAWDLVHGPARGIWRARGGQLLLGLSPLLAWEIFSLAYYGCLVPNTALAKLNVDIPAGILARQGVFYFLESARFDPVTLSLIAVAVVVAFRRSSAVDRAVGAGIALYLLYVIRIGGDFMSGRFFAAPAFAAACLLVPGTARGVRPAGAWLAAAALLLYGVLWPASPWRSGEDYGVGFARGRVLRGAGIADERAYYYPTTGLLRVMRHRGTGVPIPPYPGALLGRDFSLSPERVTTMHEVGFFGYFAGPKKTVVDVWALADPLLARIPFRPSGAWRIGHYPRRIPAGYLATLASGEDRFADRDIARWYRAIATVTRGPLFRRERWREIWRLNTGHYAAIARDAHER